MKPHALNSLMREFQNRMYRKVQSTGTLSPRHLINSNYWWNRKLCTSTRLENTLNLHAHTKHTTYTNTTKSRGTHIPALCNRKVSPVTNYDTNSLWERIRAWPLLCPNSNQAVNEAEKNGLNLVIERLFRNVNSNTCTSETLYYITGYNKTAELQRMCPYWSYLFPVHACMKLSTLNTHLLKSGIEVPVAFWLFFFFFSFNQVSNWVI